LNARVGGNANSRAPRILDDFHAEPATTKIDALAVVSSGCDSRT
jgi:hypothetical protein